MIPKTKNANDAGAITYSPSIRSNRKFPNKYWSTAMRNASENSDENIMMTPIHWKAISPYAASAVPKVKMSTPSTVIRCGFSSAVATSTIIVTHGTAAFSIWMKLTLRYRYV